jgi:hypothetical protein
VKPSRCLDEVSGGDAGGSESGIATRLRVGNGTVDTSSALLIVNYPVGVSRGAVLVAWLMIAVAALVLAFVLGALLALLL